MDRFVPRDDKIFVTARSAADKIFRHCEERSDVAVHGSLRASGQQDFFVTRSQMSRLRASGGFCEKYCSMPRSKASVICFW